MKHTHNAHRLILALALSALPFLYGISEVLALAVFAAILVAEWRAIARFLHLCQLSLAHVEQSSIRIPKKWELISTNLLTVLFLVLSVQFVSQVYAMAFTISFTTSASRETVSTVLTDIDNDGDVDWLMGNSDSGGTNDLHLNNGAGSFTRMHLPGFTTNNLTAKAGDVNGDGYVDFVQANYINGSSGRVTAYVNRGNNTFATGAVINISQAVNNVALADINNDGSLDIIIATDTATSAQSVYLNDGHGNYSVAASPLPGGQVIEVADMNNDGYLDLIITKRATDLRMVYRNSGTGAFVKIFTSVYSGGFTCQYNTALGDVDGDGLIDMLVGCTSQVYIYKNTGTGGAFSTSTLSSTLTASSMALGDLDNDGDLDLIGAGVTLGGSTTWLRIYTNGGTGTFTLSSSNTDIQNYTKISIADIDGDGDLDYVRGYAGGTSLAYDNDQAATSANTAPTAPSTNFSATTFSQNNRIISVDITNDVGSFPSIGIDSGDIPTIAYYDATAGDLKVLRCDNTPCVSVNSSSVDTTGDVGKYSNAVMPSDGLLFVAYLDVTNTDLKVLKCGNAACTSGNTITVVDSTNGYYPSVAIGSDGYPVISYTTSAGVRVAKCANAACSSGTTVSTAVADGIFTYSSIAVPSDGLPVISYLDTSGGIDFAILKMAKCGDTSCSSGNSSVTVDSFGYVNSVVIGSDDLPIIAYLGTSSALKIAHCGNSACSSGNTTTTLDSTLGTWGEGFGSPAARLMMTKPSDGLPVISYWDGTNDDLKIIKCGNTACSSGNVTSRLDSSGSVGKTSGIAFTADNRPVVAYYDGTFGDVKVLRCGVVACSSGGSNGQSLIVRLTWGSGSDSQTSTRLLQYQPKIGTGSSANNILSGRTASPAYVTRIMPNGQSRTMLLRISTCSALTYYWSVAAVDTGYKSTASDQYSFATDANCTVTDNGQSGGGTTGGITGGGGTTSSAGGGTLWRVNRGGGGGGDLLRLVVSVISDINGNRKRDVREQALMLKGLEVTASGTSLTGLPVRKTVRLSGTGVAVFDLPPSGKKGYSISFDSGALAKLGYVPTGNVTQTGVVLGASASATAVLPSVSVTLPIRRADLLRYAPCLTVGLQAPGEKRGTDAEMLLQRLKDPYGKGILSGTTLSGSLMNRGDFFALLQRTQCVQLISPMSQDLRLRKGAASLGVVLPLLDLPLNGTSDALSVYSLIGSGADITRDTSIGSAADLASPISRRDAIRAVVSLLRLDTRFSLSGALVLPSDIAKSDQAAGDYLALQKLGILPESFVTLPGIYQGLTPAEAALLLSRAAFRNGKITLLPDVEDLKLQKAATKKAAPVATFLADLPIMKARSCLLRTESRSTDVTFTDLLPGDSIHADIRELLMRGTLNAAEQMLWLLPATRRPTEFGIQHGQATLDIDEPVSLLETVRTLLVLDCLPPDTRLAAMLGLSSKEVIQGSAETRVSRDRLSGLPRDPSFASRVFYRAQDHQKEFDLSLLSYASNIERQETRSPASGLNLREGSDLLASSVLMILVQQSQLTPQKADLIASSVSAAISRDLLGKEVNWRDEGLLVRTPFTRAMLLKFLVTVVQNRRYVLPISKVSSTLSLGEIWWERIK